MSDPSFVLRLLLVPLLSAALLAPGSAAVAETPAPVEVTAVVRTAEGRLSFVTERATTRARGAELVQRLRARRGVIAAGVATKVHALDADPRRAEQWGLTRLAAEQTWAQGPATGALVAVVDTGVDASHPDLADVVVPGLDLVGSGDGRTDPHGHGTHVAGVVAAVAGNGVGGAGLAQGAKVLPVRALAADGSGYDSAVAKGIAGAVDRGATVVNLSLGGPRQSSVLEAAIAYAVSKGVVVVAAAGNAGLDGDPVLYPAATPGVIAVGALDAEDRRPAWSSSGAHLSLAAPGARILSTVPGGGYASWHGTSMAAPFVAAAAALVRADEPALTPGDVRARLMATAVDVGEPGPDAATGAGRVDVVAARAVSRPAPATQPEPATQQAAEPTASQPVEAEPVPSSPPVASEPVASEPVVSAPQPVAPPPAAPEPAAPAAPQPVAPQPVAPQPVAPQPVAPAPVAPAPAPVAPAPAPEPAPLPPAPEAVAPAPAPAPAPVAEPRTAPAPAPAVTGVRVSRSAAVVLPHRPVVLAARALHEGGPAAGRAVVLERRVGSGPWTAVRTGTTGATGLVSWTLRPDRTGTHRVRAGSVLSPELPVAVRQAVTVAARRSGGTAVVDVRVAPGGPVAVSLQVLRRTGWATAARATTSSAGTVRFVRPMGSGTRVRVVAAARPALLAGTSAARVV